MRSRRILLDPAGRVVIEEGETPVPGDGEVLLTVEASGICGTDLRTRELRRRSPGQAPLAIGHEFVGVVSQSRDGAFPVGTRAVVNPAVACGACALCRGRRGNLCPRLILLGEGSTGGGLAERVVVPGRALHAIPPCLDAVDAALVEPLSCAHRAISRAVHAAPLGRPGPTAPVAIFGAGTIGLGIAALIPADLRPSLVVIDPHPGRRRAAAEQGLAVFATAPPGLAAGLVFDASGSPAGFADAIGAAARGAVVVVVSQPAGRLDVPTGEIVGRELALVWSLGALDEDFAEVLGRFGGDSPPTRLPVRTIGLDEVDDALFDALVAGDLPKVVIRFDGRSEPPEPRRTEPAWATRSGTS